MADARDRAGRKWDRAARYLKIAFLLQGNPEGIGPQAIADHIGVSKRTVYRDLESMQSDAELPIWAEDGKWGMDDSAFLPPLALTLHEAMTLFLAARVLAKTTDEHDTELIGSFVKLASILPPVLAEHIRATVEAFATTPRNDRFTRVFRTLTEAWAARRVVELDYGPGVYEILPSLPATLGSAPLAIEPSALTHALYLMGYDEERKARRTFKVERITEASMTPDTFEVSSSATIVRELLVAWDVISDEPTVRVVIRFSPRVAARVAETRWHPSQESQPQPDGSLRWSARVAGVNEIRAWILGWGPDAEVLEPPDLRAEIAARLRDGAALYETGAAPTPSAAPARRASRTSRPNQ